MATTDTARDGARYTVVTNHEMQYSIWPSDREIPAGWQSAGQTGSRQECLAHIDEVWVDMRPLSLQEAMAAAEPPTEAPPAGPSGPSLVERLTQGLHPVVSSGRPEPSCAVLGESIDRGVVLLRFTETRGETELGVRLDPAQTDLSRADFEEQTGSVHLEGTLELDFVPLRCVVDLELSTLRGQGRLEVRAPEAI